MSDHPILTHFFQTRDEYRSNAEKAIEDEEYRKASELLWGAITQELKALAATCNVTISAHRDFFMFLRQLSHELSDRKLFQEFVDLNALHKNFYDEIIPVDDFPRYYYRAMEYLARLESLLQKSPQERD